MKKLLITILYVSLITTAHSQNNKIKVTFTTDELAFSINILNSIDISGEEIKPFSVLKNLLTDVYKDISLAEENKAVVEFTQVTAGNFLFFIQRAKLKGPEVVMFNDISNKTVEAIKKAGKQ